MSARAQPRRSRNWRAEPEPPRARDVRGECGARAVFTDVDEVPEVLRCKLPTDHLPVDWHHDHDARRGTWQRREYR